MGMFEGVPLHQRLGAWAGGCMLCGQKFTVDGSHVCPGQIKVEGIGDINSDAKGSGARYNSGKPDMSLVPLRLLATSLTKTNGSTLATLALEQLGYFQETHDPKHLYHLVELLGLDCWEACADVFTYGKQKYAAWNWAKGMPWSAPLASCARHLLAMIRGEENDAESGKPHRGHVFCNVTMLLTYLTNYPEGNDLPPKGLLK